MAEIALKAPPASYAPVQRAERDPIVGVLLALAIGAPFLASATLKAMPGASMPGWLEYLGMLSAATALVLVMLDIRYGMAYFIMFAALSPRIPGLNYNNLRLEDGMFVVLFLSWSIRALRAGRLPRPRSPLTAPFLAVTLMGIFSSMWGVSLGQIDELSYSILVQFKRIEYFMIFWMVATSINSERWLRAMIMVFVASGAVCALYGLLNQGESYLAYSETRVGGPPGEQYNTLSGFLVICIGVGIAAIPEIRIPSWRVMLIGAVGVMVAGILFSFSREGLVMLLGSIVILVGTRHRALGVLALFALVPALLLGPVGEHVQDTFHKIEEAPGGSAGSNSLTARFRAWEYRWNGWFVKQPVVGNGVGSVSFSVDNEYLLRACESGLIGLGLFIWLLLAIRRQIKHLSRLHGNTLCRLLATGSLAAFTGLLIQGTVAVSFNTIRTMEPFWFLLGLGACALAVCRQATIITPAPAPQILPTRTSIRREAVAP
jgi:hypothetical protein